MVTVLLICFIPNGVGTLTAKAEGSTYCIRYVASAGEYRYVTGSTWPENASHRELYYLKEALKDGDLLVVDSFADDPDPLSLNISNINLSNITVLAGTAFITVASCTDFYAVKSAVASITGNVANAHVYDSAKVNFNNNVDSLEMVSPYNGNINGLGSATKVFSAKDGVELSAYYDFAVGSLRVVDGKITTDASKYSTTPSATATQAVAEAPTPAPAPAADSDSEYDDVPKTGVIETSSILLIMSGILFLVAIGTVVLKRKES